MNAVIPRTLIQTFQQIHAFKMYWIFIPSLIISLIYLAVQNQSEGYFDVLHAFDVINIFGWKIELKSYISNVEWFFFFLLFEVFKFVVLTLLSPFNAYISELYDQKLTGNKFKFSFWRMLEDILRGLIISFTVFSLEMLFTGFWLILNLFLPLEYFTPLAYMTISSFFFGFAYLDFSLERHDYDVSQSWQYAFQKMSICFKIGTLFSLIMYIPNIGIIIAPPTITLLATQWFLNSTKKSLDLKRVP